GRAFSFFLLDQPRSSPTVFPSTPLFRSGGRDVETDLAHRHANVRSCALHVDFLRTRERLDRLLVDLGGFTEMLLFCTHQTGSSIDRKSTRLNSSHVKNSYAVFCSQKNTC